MFPCLAALDALAHCHFEHCVDPPSLALIVPVLQRGLRERAANSKRKTAHISGNMCSLLADQKDIVPYLPLLLPALQAFLLDPIPEVKCIYLMYTISISTYYAGRPP